jgi:hypothetical protein
LDVFLMKNKSIQLLPCLQVSPKKSKKESSKTAPKKAKPRGKR